MSRETDASREAGSAVAEFTLVTTLLVLIVAGLLQLALALHVRNTLISCAAAGARVAASEDRDGADGVARAQAMARDALGDYDVLVTSRDDVSDGVPVVVVTISAPIPAIGLWGWGSLTVEGRAFREVDRGAP